MGTIRVSATFPNPGNVLRPGQYGRVRAQTVGPQAGAAGAAARGVRAAERLSSCASSTADNKVAIRTVTLGPRVGNRWIVEKGLQAGDRVIVDAPSLQGRHAGRRRTRAPAAESARDMSRFFIRRPDRRHRHRHRHRARRPGGARRPADRAVPADRAAADHRHGAVSRRRRADHRAVGRHAARAADERRRRHALHAVDQRQRRHDDADRDVRRRHRPEHRSGQRPEPAWRRRSRTCRPRSASSA